MPIGGRADQSSHGQGVPGLPATLGWPAADYGAPGPAIGAQLGGDIRRHYLTSQPQPWDHLDGYAVPMAHLAGPDTGQLVIERSFVRIDQASALWVLVGPVGDYRLARTLDYVHNFAPDGEPAPHLYAIGSDPQPLRILPGEELSLIWIATYASDCWAHVQARWER
jgi:hypothetical protein